MTIRALALALCLSTLLTMAAAPTALGQQMTAESLLSSSIEQIGPEHADVASAIEQFQKGQFLESRKLLEAAKTKDAKLPPAGILFARMLFAANQPNLGRAELERVAKEDPTDPESFIIFGELAFQGRRYAEASLAYNQAGKLLGNYKTNPLRRNNLVKRTYSGLAGVAEVHQDWSTATRYLNMIVKQDPKDINNTTRLAQVLFKQDENLTDQKGSEVEAYQKLIALWEADKENVRRPEITMGALYQQAGQKAMAAQLMKKASTSDTKNLATQLTVARWALEAGDMALATSCTSRAVQISPQSVQAKLIAGLTSRYKEDLAGARKALEAAHLQAPSNLAAILQLAVVLVEGSDADKQTAIAYSQLATRLASDLSTSQGRESAVTGAWVAYRMGQTTEAQRILQRALAGGSVSAESSYFAARIISPVNADFAKQMLQKALQNEGVFPARTKAEQLLKSLGG